MSTPALASFDPTYQPPGNFYLMVGGFRIYIHCEGEGEYPIIIETGIGDSSANWLPIQQQLATHTKVCLYDRAGYGLSDPGPGPRTAAQIAYELYALLAKAGITGPYILVGHSFGGYVMQYFSQVFPAQTAGVVLVESSHPDQITRLAALDNMKDKPKRNIGGYKFEDLSKLTKEQRYWKHLNAQRKSVWAQMDELKVFKQSAKQVKSVQYDLAATVPLAVLTRGKSQLPVVDNKSIEAEWQAMQKNLTDLSGKSWQVIVKDSGHSLHQDAPEVVIENVLKVLTLVKDN